MSQINVTTIRNRTGGPPSLDQGVVVGSAATFSSTVSIAGTLTYEDVTNIDSVGIITARTGLKVTAGGIDVTAGGINVTAGIGTFSGDVSIADKIIHTGDINTAIRFPSADTFAVETAGSEALRIDSSGNMGIGGAITDNYGTNHRVVQIHSGSSTNSYLSLTNSTTGDQGASHGLNLIQTGVNALVNNRSAGYLAFQTSDVERMRIDSSGASTFFGEITASNASLSSFKLDYNSSQFDAYLQLRGNDLEIRGSSGQMEFYTGSADGASSTERMRLTDGGQLLINTTSNGGNAEPALIVSGRANAPTDSAIMYIKRGEAAASVSPADALGEITWSALDGGPAAQILAKAWTGWTGTSDCPGNLIFKTTADGGNAPTERMNIDHKGIVTFSSGGSDGVTITDFTNGNVSFADDATSTISGAINTAALVAVNGQQYGGTTYPSALFFVMYGSSTIVKLADPDGAFDVADTDGKICIYKSANSTDFTVKNRVGVANPIAINVLGLKGA